MNKRPPTERRQLVRKLIIDLSIMTVIGVVLAFIGPFGSFAEPLAYRLVSWLSFAYLGYAIYSPMSYFVGKLQALLDLPVAGLWIAAVLIATVPMTILVWSIGFLPGPIRMPTLEQALTSYFYVLVVGGGVTALFYALESRNATEMALTGNVAPEPDAALNTAPTASGKASSSPMQPRFVDRLPAELGTGLIALEMEDHYVRAHTTLGSELVLMRMRDAVAELDGLDGMQVHRSWWVARGADADIKREGRNVRLVLENGMEAPVSRANVSALKDAGWI